ncbi:haloacid dehalogenase type II [Streptomyces sp. NPDC019531]|uniref:haloacid dehalogenase type II n=1 Tax=Streptomyces sp. NPDC019531 TaxID=3365062 RepID=UPI00384D4699
MAEIRDIEVVVFDVLGTLVDEPTGLRAGIREAAPASDEASVEELLGLWERHREREQQRIGQGLRAYANTEVIDEEAAQLVADHAGFTDPATVARLATVGRRLPPWADSVAALDQLARHFPVLGLSNAGHSALPRLNAHAGLRWHQALSAETAQAYKPAPEVYQLAIAAAGCAPDRVLMVAAHAWDLRGAQARGMRTAYVRRPVGDPPTSGDDFDGRFDGLDELVAALTVSQPVTGTAFRRPAPTSPSRTAPDWRRG